MFGSNTFGQGYYGQGPAVSQNVFFKALSATVKAAAGLSSSLVLNVALLATVKAGATLTKQARRTLSATVTTVTSVVSRVFHALKLLRGISKSLNRRASTRNLNPETATTPVGGFSRSALRVRIPTTEAPGE